MLIALHFPRLSLEVYERAFEQACPPMAIASHLAIVQANTLAEQAGVSPGQRRATAQALSPNLVLLERSLPKEREALEQMACWAAQFTPQVAITSHGLVLNVQASLRLFGGVHTIAQALLQGMASLGFTTTHACAPTGTGAMLLARAHSTHGASGQETIFPSQARLNNALMPLPIVFLDAALPHAKALSSMGVNTLKALMQLPRAGLAQRVGPALLAELDRACGKHPEGFIWYEIPSSFEVKLELMAQVEHAGALLFAAQRLLVQLSGWLEARQSAVQTLYFSALHDDAEPTAITLEFAQAVRDVNRMNLILRERLDKTRLPEAAHSLVLSCPQVVSLAHANTELFLNAQTQQDGLLTLVERLQARLGREQIVRLELTEDHRPEAAQVLAQFSLSVQKKLSRVTARPVTTSPLPHGMPRPLWLYPQPIPISERHNRPWFHGPIQLLAGPERIEGAWWAHGAGNTGLVERDYFIGLNQDMHMLWLYRSDAWHIQGIFG
jgi:protein ImuB